MNVQTMYRLSGILAWCLYLLMIPLSTALAADPPGAGKPFAEAHIVLQMGDGDAKQQTMVLNVANNLIKHYGGPDLVDIEIVAYGPGIALLFTDNPNAERIVSLAANGVRFAGCMNTVDTIERTTGQRPRLNAVTIPVQTGVAHLVERAGQGFVVIRP